MQGVVFLKMCGICGTISREGRESNEDELRSMLPALSERGPDHRGVNLGRNFAFGHSRLSIIDLTEQGNQPMENKELGLVITCNGEIYNYRELREELKNYGYSFTSNSDIEVMMKAYDHWGERFVERLMGMFAFCLYDRKKDKFILGRDRLGKKPLYYTEKNGTFYFASNIQALNDAGVVDQTLDRTALHYYLTFHAVVPAPRTIFSCVKKVEPGTVMTIDRDGRKSLQRYWSLKMAVNKDLSEDDWVEAILDKLRISVKRRMVSDVPVGALLSGGVDSSLIVALMAELDIPDLRTYSIGFDTVNGEEGNEFYYSDIIARKYGTKHEKIYADGEDLLPRVIDCLTFMAEPMVSHDAVGFFLLAREVSKKSRVVLCGQGADEIFGGYHWYPRIMESEGTSSPEQIYREQFFDRNHQEVLDTLDEKFHPEEDYSFKYVSDHFAGSESGTRGVEKALHIDTTVMLIDDPVKRVDNMTMAWGLEARVPFLDHELVELAASIPPEMKVKEGGKYILKKAAEQVIPHEVIYRKKGYFPVPALKYMRGEFLEYARDILYSDQAKERGLFNSQYLDRLFENPAEQLTALRGNKIWQAAVLEAWLQGMEG
ncbi:MAG: N-acetylglutaminylglutamine amidotransferase [Bacillota bacterium]|nr:N-acetylglutaminylglutamine amidotransferase [Bacillota bacterium]